MIANRITGEPVIVAPDREQRPNVYRGDDCPFCPGRESQTPPPIATDGDPWRIRVFANKYPATNAHEVIVESANHDDGFDDLDPQHAARAVDMALDRYQALRQHGADSHSALAGWRAGATSHVSLFRNHGPLAGASISHLHSQIVGTPFVPPRVAREAAAFARASACPLCDLADEPSIEETEHFRWIAPRGASFGYQQWIVPREHANEVGEAHELAQLLQRSARAMRSLSDSYNSIFMNFPGQPRAHWYVEIVPRTAMIAGFEIGSATAINTVEAAAAAELLRKAR